MTKRCLIPMLSLAFMLTGVENARAESTSLFDDSASFTVAKVVSLGRTQAVTNGADKVDLRAGTSSGKGTTIFKECSDKNCATCNHSTGICQVCNGGYQLQNGLCTEIPQDTRNAECVRLCGAGYYYDRPGAKNNGAELVCTRYKYPCGYGCTTGWDFRYLVNGTNYTCQDAKQTEDKNQLCEQLCDMVDPGHGAEYHYDRLGDKRNDMFGQERVCTRYPLSCGYACTRGWDFNYMVTNTKNGLQTNYTCQSAVQTDYEGDEAKCNSICGSGFHYDRPGALNNGAERVCTKYPQDCGYDCTIGWDIVQLKNNTNYTCQTAIQDTLPTSCSNRFYINSDGTISVPSAKSDGTKYDCVDTYGHQATVNMPSGTPSYYEVNIRMWETATVNGAFNTNIVKSLYNTRSQGNVITFKDAVSAQKVILDEGSDGKVTKMVFEGGLSGNPTCEVVKGVDNSYYTPTPTSTTCSCKNNVCEKSKVTVKQVNINGSVYSTQEFETINLFKGYTLQANGVRAAILSGTVEVIDEATGQKVTTVDPWLADLTDATSTVLFKCSATSNGYWSKEACESATGKTCTEGNGACRFGPPKATGCSSFLDYATCKPRMNWDAYVAHDGCDGYQNDMDGYCACLQNQLGYTRFGDYIGDDPVAASSCE